jgi:hypothetical protein
MCWCKHTPAHVGERSSPAPGGQPSPKLAGLRSPAQPHMHMRSRQAGGSKRPSQVPAAVRWVAGMLLWQRHTRCIAHVSHIPAGSAHSQFSGSTAQAAVVHTRDNRAPEIAPLLQPSGRPKTTQEKPHRASAPSYVTPTGFGQAGQAAMPAVGCCWYKCVNTEAGSSKPGSC